MWIRPELCEPCIAFDRVGGKQLAWDGFSGWHTLMLDHRVHPRAVLAETIVKVGPGREPGLAHAADQLSLSHMCAGPHCNRREVQVRAFVPAGVPDAEHSPRSAVPPCT